MDQFQIGDNVVYPGTGLAQVIGIEQKEIAGQTRRFYACRSADSQLKILVPLDNADKVGLRPVVRPSEIAAVYELLQTAEQGDEQQPWNRRQRALGEKLRTGNLFEIAEVVRDLHRLRERKTLAHGERVMLDKARAQLVAELAVVKNSERALVERELEAVLSRAA